MSDEFLVPPPSSVTVEHSHRPVLYLPDGRALVRQAGYGAPYDVSRLQETRREGPVTRRQDEK